MKKYALTGHTDGIGKELFKKLSPNCIGFSLSSGYDITKKSDRQRIIDESNECDVFINNAHADFAQSELCLELWHSWKDKNKTIINVGSKIAEESIILTDNYAYLLSYSMQKRTLKKLSEDLSKINTKLIIKYKWFGYVNTPKIIQKYPNITNNDYITIEEAINIILKE